MCNNLFSAFAIAWMRARMRQVVALCFSSPTSELGDVGRSVQLVSSSRRPHKAAVDYVRPIAGARLYGRAYVMSIAA